MNKKNKFIILSLTVIFPVLIILLINLISSLWIITSNSSIKTDFIEKPDFNPACELDLESILTDVKNDYSAVKHAPEVDSSLTDVQKAFINEHYTITYYKNGSQVTNPVDAGTYTAIYFNKTTHRVTEIEFEIDPIDASFNVNQEFDAVYYSPTIFETINTSTFTATGINNSSVLGTFTLSQGGKDENGNEIDGVINEGTSSDQISLEINVEFESSNPNYKDATFTIEVPIHAVCHIGAYSSPKYYGRIENAVKAAAASDASDYIYVLLKGNNLNTINKPIIYENCTISAKDSLVAPYSLGGITVTYSKNRKDFGTKTLKGTNGYLYNWTDSEKDLESKNTNIESGTTIESRLFADGNSVSENKYLKTIITLNDNVVLTVDGNLILGGVLGNSMFSEMQGHTSGSYTQINMRPGSKIVCNGNIESRGYIKEVDSNDNYTKNYACEVIVNNNGTLSMPYVIYDYNGGANMIGTFKGAGNLLGGIQNQPSKIFAYNQFDLPNIHSLLKINYGGTLQGYADVYTGSISVSIISLDEQHNSTVAKIVGKQDSLFNLSTSSSIEFETKLNTPGYTSNVVGSKVTNVYLRGNTELGGVDLTVTVATITATVSSSEVCLPVSYLYNINVDSGTFNVNNSVKILPGGQINVNGDSVLNIGNGSGKNPKFIIYSNYSNGTGRPPSLEYPTTLDEGKLNINNGTINIKGTSSFGGEITASSADALINVDKDVTFTMSEEEGYGGSSGTSVTYTQTFSITEKFRLNFLNSNKVSATVTQINAPETFKALEYNTNQYCFTYKYAYINYVTNVIGYEIPKKRVDLFAGNNYIGYEFDEVTDCPSIDISKYKPGYSYVWQPIPIENMFDSVTINAIWTINTYNITYYNYYVDSQGNIITDEMVDKVTNLNVTSFNCLDKVILTAPTLLNADEKYTFMGWYSDANLQNLISEFNGSEVLDDISIYGKWMEEQDKSYNVTYKQVYFGNSDNVFTQPVDQKEFEFKLEDIKFVYLTSIPSLYNGVTSNPFYFEGWYNNESCDGTPLTVDEAKALLTEENNNITLYGKVVDKTYRLKLIDIYGNEHKYYYQDETIVIDKNKFSLNETQLAGKLLWFNSSDEDSVPIFDSDTEYTLENYKDKFVQNTTYNTVCDLTLYCKVYYYITVTYTTNSHALINGSSDKGVILTGNNINSIATISIAKNQQSTSVSYYCAEGAVLTFTASNAEDSKNAAISSGGTYTVNQNGGTHSVSASGESCIVSGSLLTLADGTKKKVEDLTLDDKLLVFNHETGQFESSPIVFIDNDGWKEYNVINLVFSNGTITRLIYEHGYFDLTSNKYVYITEVNYRDYIGHDFVITDGTNISSVKLIDSYITNEYVGCYSPVTAVHLNYIVDGLLSMPGGIEGIFNIFEYGEGLKFDEELMKEDIEKYGIMEYEVLAEYVPYEMYYAFNAKYFNVAIGKGLITFDEILHYAEKYLNKHGLLD